MGRFVLLFELALFCTLRYLRLSDIKEGPRQLVEGPLPVTLGRGLDRSYEIVNAEFTAQRHPSVIEVQYYQIHPYKPMKVISRVYEHTEKDFKSRSK